jgi:hypothetical protein
MSSCWRPRSRTSGASPRPSGRRRNRQRHQRRHDGRGGPQPDSGRALPPANLKPHMKLGSTVSTLAPSRPGFLNSLGYTRPSQPVTCHVRYRADSGRHSRRCAPSRGFGGSTLSSRPGGQVARKAVPDPKENSGTLPRSPSSRRWRRSRCHERGSPRSCAGSTGCEGRSCRRRDGR